MRRVFALLLLGCACGRGLSVHVEGDAGAKADAGEDPGCDVILQNCPNPAEACYPRPIGAPVCSSVGTQGEGGPCSLSTDCFAGFTCTGGGQSVCHKICLPNSSTNTCGEGQSCSALADFGVCTPPGSYSACVYSGGLDHITLRHSEPARNLCTLVLLSSPGTNTRAALSLPPNWEVQSATIAMRDGGCAFDFVPTAGVFADDLTGRIDFFVPDGGYLPTRAEAFINLSAPMGAGVPSETSFVASQMLLGSCF